MEYVFLSICFRIPISLSFFISRRIVSVDIFEYNNLYLVTLQNEFNEIGCETLNINSRSAFCLKEIVIIVFKLINMI